MENSAAWGRCFQSLHRHYESRDHFGQGQALRRSFPTHTWEKANFLKINKSYFSGFRGKGTSNFELNGKEDGGYPVIFFIAHFLCSACSRVQKERLSFGFCAQMEVWVKHGVGPVSVLVTDLL